MIKVDNLEKYLRLLVSNERKTRQEFVRNLRFPEFKTKPKPKGKPIIILWSID